MKLDCLIAGVGGQGTVLASKMLAQTAVDNGFFARTSETIGMAQRGGCVVSHVRCGRAECAPAIGKAQANLVVGFEPAEAVRNIDYLSKNGTVVMNICPITPVTAALGNTYAVKQMIEYVKKSGYKNVMIDGNTLCKLSGSAKVLNIIMTGALIGEGLVPFTKEQFTKTLINNLPPQFIELNLKALEIGFNYHRLQEVVL